MVNSLRDDPWIRAHYQFWVFTYPSGYPYPYSATLLRRELDGIKHAFRNHTNIAAFGLDVLLDRGSRTGLIDL